MQSIVSVKIEEYLEKSKAGFFLIFLQQEDGRLMTWTTEGFHQIVSGHQDTQLFMRNEIVSEYYNALREACEEKIPDVLPYSGRLDVVDILLPS